MSFIKRVEQEVNNIFYFLKTKFDDANHFDAVPDELIIHIFSLLGSTRLEGTCKRFYEISLHPLVQNQSLRDPVRIAFRNLLGGNSEQLEKAAAELVVAAVNYQGSLPRKYWSMLNSVEEVTILEQCDKLQAFYDAVK